MFGESKPAGLSAEPPPSSSSTFYYAFHVLRGYFLQTIIDVRLFIFFGEMLSARARPFGQ